MTRTLNDLLSELKASTAAQVEITPVVAHARSANSAVASAAARASDGGFIAKHVGRELLVSDEERAALIVAGARG